MLNLFWKFGCFVWLLYGVLKRLYLMLIVISLLRDGVCYSSTLSYILLFCWLFCLLRMKRRSLFIVISSPFRVRINLPYKLAVGSCMLRRMFIWSYSSYCKILIRYLLIEFCRLVNLFDLFNTFLRRLAYFLKDIYLL